MGIWRWTYGGKGAGPIKYGRDPVAIAPEVLRGYLMRVSLNQIASLAERAVPESKAAAGNCAWLEACGYPGIRLLLEARADERRTLPLVPDAMGLDLQNVSCVFLGPEI